MSAATPVLGASGEAPVRASRHHVDVWEVALGVPASEAASTTLSDSERGHAARLRVGAGYWVAARAALRDVLGRYLGLAPGKVALDTDPNGKPRLAPGGNTDLRFNLSHSGDIALIAVRLGHEVGVDVEWLRPGVDGAAISREVFTAPERAAMAALATDGAGETFFRAWVRREALAKVTGRGIVSLPGADDAERYTVRDLDGIPGFAAALASEGADWSARRIRCPLSSGFAGYDSRFTITSVTSSSKSTAPVNSRAAATIWRIISPARQPRSCETRAPS